MHHDCYIEAKCQAGSAVGGSGGKMGEVRRGFLIFNIGVILVFAGAAVATAKWTTVRVGNLVFKVEGKLSPKAFPRHEFAPASFRTRAEIATSDSTHPPALREGVVYIDKNGEIAFPEQRPILVESPITIFNGGVEGKTTTMYLHAFITVPTPAAIVSSFKFTRVNAGRYGLRGVAAIPVIAGGSGSITDFDFKIKRLYTYKGKRKSYDLTKCPDGVIKAKGTGVFKDEVADGVNDGEKTTISASLSFPCTPKG